MPTTSPSNMVIVPIEAFEALQTYARSHRLKGNPSQILLALLNSNGIYLAAWLADPFVRIKRLQLNDSEFKSLQLVQQQMNSGPHNFSLMDIILANLVIWLGANRLYIQGEMVAYAENREGVSTVTRDDRLWHRDLQSGTESWRLPTILPSFNRKKVRFETEPEFDFDKAEEEWERSWFH